MIVFDGALSYETVTSLPIDELFKLNEQAERIIAIRKRAQK